MRPAPSPAFVRRLYSISPLLPFYLLGVSPGEVIWPFVLVPLILAANFAWTLIIATVAVITLGQTERVGQHHLVRYAIWTTLGGLIVNIGHDFYLAVLSENVDFLLEAQPWRLVGTSYLLPCVLLFVYHFLLSWQYLGLRPWQSALLGLTFALLTAPWSTLAVLDFGQGRLPVSSQGFLWLGVLALAVAPWILVTGAAILRRIKTVPRLAGLAILVALGLLAAAGGWTAWSTAISSSAIGSMGTGGLTGDLAFAAKGRLYVAQAGGAGIQSLGQWPGKVVTWSPNGRLLLINDQREGQSSVVVVPAGATTGGAVVGSGEAGPAAWSPDSGSVLYAALTESSGQIHLVRADGRDDRVLTEGRSPSWSPDGRRILYAARTAGRWQVWVMLPDGSDPIQLTSEGGEDPVWSPDGRFIAYVQNNRAQVMDADGTSKRRLAADSAFADTRPTLAWSPDGQSLAYVYSYAPESGRPTQLYIWETSTPASTLNGTPVPSLLPTPGRSLQRSGDFRPPFAWAPDGAWLGFVRGGDIWALNVRSGEERRLAPGDSYAWGSKSRGVVVRPVPTYPPTPTPTALPPSVVESPAVLLLDARDPSIILAGTTTGIVKKAAGGGWFLSATGIVYPTNVRAMAVDPSSPTTLYAGTDGERSVAGTLYKSSDGGVRWTATGLRDIDVYAVLIDPRRSSDLYAGTAKGFYNSDDGGATWTQSNSGLKSSTVQALAIDAPSTGLTSLYLGTRQGEIYKSTTGGSDWKLVQSINSPVTSLLVRRQRTATVFATTEEGLFFSTDGGDTWNQVSGGIWKERLDGLVVHPTDNTVYAYGAQGVFVSHDGGNNWGPASSGLEGTQPSALVIDPKTPAVLYCGTDKGVYKTSNGGVTWNP